MKAFIHDKVSVVIPVFNGEFHLQTILDSLLRQTYSLVEVILVDDGSEDKTVQVAESYREKFACKGYDYYIVRAGHKNASAALNHGLPYVTGEYLIWPDSDDRLEMESIAKRVRFLQSNPQYQCVRTLAYYYDQRTGKILTTDEKTGDISKENLFWDILEQKTYVCCGCYMLKSEYFFKIYPERHIPEYDVGQNFQMLLPYLFYHLCPTIPEALYGVCVRAGSHSRTRLTREEEEKKYQDYEKLIDEISILCHMEDEESKNRIMYWKIQRRYHLAVKYKNGKKMIEALWQMNKHVKIGFYQTLKDLLWRLIFRN